VRLDLVRDGFPTDRVDLTAECDPGRVALGPAGSPHEMLIRHFGGLFSGAGERAYVERLAELIEHGGAAVTIHPRGPLETLRVREILSSAHPLEVADHDVSNQRLEHAAAAHARPWIRTFWVDSDHPADCIYCRLFEGHHPD
jgi:hypothetical protein